MPADYFVIGNLSHHAVLHTFSAAALAALATLLLRPLGQRFSGLEIA